MNPLKTIFPFLEFNTKNFGYKPIDQFTERDKEKNLIKYGNISLFISGEMYPETDKNFVYAILEQKIEKKIYRCKTWFESTYNKQFFSAKTETELIEKLIKANKSFKFN